MKRLRYLMAVMPVFVLSAPLIAAGGGGGGGSGGGMPSETAPRYDPAEEYRKGVTALQARDFKTAKTAFDRVIVAAPRDANTQYLAGVTRIGLGDWKGARKFLEKAVKLNPDLTGASRELGVTYGKLRDMPKAQAVLSDLKAKADSCGTCAKAGELKAAVDAVSAAVAGAPQARATDQQSLLFASTTQGDGQYLAAVGLINERRYEAAIVLLEQSRSAFGPHPDILTYLGFANRKLKRYDVAQSYYLQALAVAPHHRGATEYYGELMVERGDMAGARKQLALLDAQCRFGCYEAEELRQWVASGHSPHS
jgi:tetratricopeptide (TPR) repeat protein